MIVTADDVIRTARQFDYIRELPMNRGQRVEAIQHWCSGQIGDSWCCHWATMVLDIAYKGNSPIPRGGSCQALLEYATARRMVFSTAQLGDLFLYLNDAKHAHHIGLVTLLQPLTGIAGNTSADGTSVNGDRVAEHRIVASTFVRYLGR